MNEQNALEESQGVNTDAESPREAASGELEGYRELLVAAEKESQDAYDKTVLSLSSGALGVSFAFLSNIVGDPPYVLASLLFTAWILWGSSSTLVLASFLLSQLSLRKAIGQIDRDQLYSQKPGGWYSTGTTICNFASGALFVLGVLSLVVFVYKNLEAS